MYIIVRKNSDMPYYVGTNEKGVISWTNSAYHAKSYGWWVIANKTARGLRNLMNDSTITVKGG